MPRLFHRALALLLCLLLVQAALPTRVGVVCVENGRVVALCPMATIPERIAAKVAEQAPAMARMACCRPRVAASKVSLRPADSCPIHRKSRCAYAYRSGQPSISGAEHPRVETPRLTLVAVLQAPVEAIGDAATAASWTPGIIGTDSGPPTDPTTRAPSGRAPPAR